jgi:hypothetical protein
MRAKLLGTVLIIVVLGWDSREPEEHSWINPNIIET